MTALLRDHLTLARLIEDGVAAVKMEVEKLDGEKDQQ
jgi:hypothetical protein